MEALYVDTSALVKRYVRESGSEEVRAWLAKASHVATALITQAEMAAALAKGVRMGGLTPSEGQRAWEAFLEDWSALFRISLSPALIRRGASLAWELDLRGYDAVHLAAALAWQEGIDRPVGLLTYDRRLREAARSLGLTVGPESP